MIVLDVNLLLYAYNSASARHDAAHALVAELFSGTDLVGLPWQTIWAFLRIFTNPRLPGEQFSMGEAVAIVRQWMELKQVRLLAPGERHWTLLRQMLIEGRVRGPWLRTLSSPR